MKHYFLHIFLLVTLGVAAQQQDCPYYQRYIDKGDAFLKEKKFMEAINAFSTAMLHCPDNAKEARERIQVTFNKIDELKNKAIANEKKVIDLLESEKEAKTSLETEIVLSESRRIEAVTNFNKAREARFLSDAYKYIFFAQEAVKVDPILALHITDTALKILDSVRNIEKNDSSIYEKALRIYYENNFGETIIDKESSPGVKGGFTQTIYAPDGKTIWTLTDSAYAYQWSSSGKLMDSIILDPALKKYEFKQSMEGKVLIYGKDENQKSPAGKIWQLQKKATPIIIPANEAPKMLLEKKDSIIYHAKRDSSENWAKRLFVFGNRAFHITNDGRLSPVIAETSNEIGLVAFSPNGKFVAVSGVSPEVKIFNVNGSFIRRIGAGNPPVSMEFPENNLLAVNNRIILRLFDLTGKLDNTIGTLRDPQSINIQGYPLQTFKFSSNGKMLLVSFSNRTQQIAKLYKKHPSNWTFTEFAEFTCIGAPSTSANFSNNPDEIITSSDKIRVWKIPKDKTVPQFLSGASYDQNSYFSVEHNLEENLVYGYSIAGKKVKFNLDGSKTPPTYADSTYQPDSVTSKITAFIPGIKKAVIVSENGDLNMFHEKQPLEAYLKTFRFEPFTESQKRKYGIK